MRVASTVSKVFMWITAVLAALFQCMAMWGIHINNTGFVDLGKPEKQYNLLPLMIATAAMLIAVLLFSFLPRRVRFIGVILMGVTALVFIPLALDLGRQFPVHISSGGDDRGLDTWNVLYRHMLPVVTAVLMLVAWLCDRAIYKQDQLRLQEEAKKGHYDLSGGPLFSDTSKKKTAAAEEPEKAPRRKKYAKKRAAEKE